MQLETAAAAVPLKLTRSRQHGGSADDIGQITFAWMRQPIPAWALFPRTAQLLAALGVPASGLPVESYTNGPTLVYVALPDEAAVTALKPDITALAGFAGSYVYCFAGSGRHWRSRLFAPAALGVTEDPATGSAAGPLAIHLARHGRIEFGEAVRSVAGESARSVTGGQLGGKRLLAEASCCWWLLLRVSELAAQELCGP